MKLPSREPSTHGLDRMRLTEDVAERHGAVVGRLVRRGKPWLAAAALSALTACGPERPAAVAAPPPPAPSVAEPVTSSTGPSLVLRSPVDESRRALAAALATADAHERCRLLLEATLLDPASVPAQVARAESRCAVASELLPNVRAVFSAKRDSASATLLATVALRANATADVAAAAAALEKLDLPDRLAAAKLYVRLGDHLRAAALYADVAAARATKGATTDALDARLDVVIETARGGKPAAALLGEALPAASGASKSYGAAWVGPKVVEAIGAIRSAGEDVSELVKRSLALGLFAGPAEQDALAIERAIAAARAGKPTEGQLLLGRLRARVNTPSVRALEAVLARASGACADAHAHARAHAWLSSEGLRLDDDVAWARACTPTGPVRATIVAPVASEEVADLRALAEAEPLRARALLEAWTKAHPSDPAAWLASIDVAATYDRQKVVARATAALPNEPWVRFAELGLATGAALPPLARAFTTTVLPATIEASASRALAPLTARVLLLGTTADPAWDDVAESLVRACAVGAASPCLDAERAAALPRATDRLRRTRWKFLAARGIALSGPDLAQARTRLDVVLALVALGDLQKAGLFAAPLAGPEGALARTSIAAASNKCPTAKEFRKGTTALSTDYADALASVDKKCK